MSAHKIFAYLKPLTVRNINFTFSVPPVEKTTMSIHSRTRGRNRPARVEVIMEFRKGHILKNEETFIFKYPKEGKMTVTFRNKVRLYSLTGEGYQKITSQKTHQAGLRGPRFYQLRTLMKLIEKNKPYSYT
jgi:hypothetical protein